ncbi:HNH endonuclease [Nocardia higoensis]|uniref:HNH endonuclease n=1 Tax=Nocardia higoensis TaxID=228599 RepID=A0ABS0D3B2_9NOCA|nr:HNH endonuclease [Nocardia higoensis]MBF6352975.1 HNH endonuclease [Nocardia higoensis]
MGSGDVLDPETVTPDRRAWLVMSKSVYLRLGGGRKYDDDPSNHYSWDSFVPNSRQVKVGDVIAVWDNTELLGVSVIENIDVKDGTKHRGRCPGCNETGFKRRLRKKPTFRCDCGAEFDDPIQEEVPAKLYRSDYGQAWVDLSGVLGGKDLRALCLKDSSQNSFRELNWDKFRAAVGQKLGADYLAPVDVTAEQIRGGHAVRPVRVRLGQSNFRKKLLARYGPRCAFTGDLHQAVLEACHLYSYAKVGKHHEHGGVLLRRDLHTLFDRGDLAVNSVGLLDVSEPFRDFSIYGELHGKPLAIDISTKQADWFKLHWAMYRKADN